MKHALNVVACIAVVTSGCGPSEQCGAPVFDIQAHRGGRAQRPENTLPAFEYALSKGIRTLEMDLAVTSDDVIVLSHDPILIDGRCLKADGSSADGLKIRQMTSQEVRALDCGKPHNKDFPNQVSVEHTPPPTLQEVFALAESRAGGRVHYNIEPKMDPAWGDDVTPPAEKFIDLMEAVIKQAGTADRITIQSFDPRPLHELRRRDSALRLIVLVPSTELGLNLSWLANPVELAISVGAVAVSSYGPITRKPFVDGAHLRGLKVIPWTVNDRDELDRLADSGVDGIISDDVDLLMDWSTHRKFSGGVCW